MNRFGILAIMLASAMLLFGCIGGTSQPVTGAADGDFHSLNIRNGPSTFTGTVNMTQNVSMSGNVTVTGNISFTSGVLNVSSLGSNLAFTGTNTHNGSESFNGTVNLTGATISSANKVTATSGTFVNGTNGKVFNFGQTYLSAPKVVISPATAFTPLNVSFYVGAINTTAVTVNSTQAPDANVTIEIIAVGAT